MQPAHDRTAAAALGPGLGAGQRAAGCVEPAAIVTMRDVSSGSSAIAGGALRGG